MRTWFDYLFCTLVRETHRPLSVVVCLYASSHTFYRLLKLGVWHRDVTVWRPGTNNDLAIPILHTCVVSTTISCVLPWNIGVSYTELWWTSDSPPSSCRQIANNSITGVFTVPRPRLVDIGPWFMQNTVCLLCIVVYVLSFMFTLCYKYNIIICWSWDNLKLLDVVKFTGLTGVTRDLYVDHAPCYLKHRKYSKRGKNRFPPWLL